MSDPVTATIGAAGGLVGGILNLFSSNKQNKENARQNALNRKFAHDEAALAHSRQLQIMNAQNSYNSPANQRELYQQAGYNPNALISGGYSGSVSTGASGGAQASTPSNIPMQNTMDPTAMASLISAVSDSQLKAKQGDLIDAQAKKVGSETIGQDLQNTFDEIRNDIYKDFGRLQAQYGLDYQDSQRALNDAQRLLINSAHSLNLDELVTMRPLEAGKLIAETLFAESQSELARIAGLKDKQDMDLALREFALKQQMAAATIVETYSRARMNDSTTALNWQTHDMWHPGGLLYMGQQNNNASTAWMSHLNRQQYYFQKNIYDETLDGYVTSMKSYFKRVNTINHLWPILEPFANNKFFNLTPQRPARP